MRQTKRLLALVLALVMTLSLSVMNVSAALDDGPTAGVLSSSTTLTGKVKYKSITVTDGATITITEGVDLTGLDSVNVQDGKLYLGGTIETANLTIGKDGQVNFTEEDSKLSASGETKIYTETPFKGDKNFEPTGTVTATTTAGQKAANDYSGTTKAKVDEDMKEDTINVSLDETTPAAGDKITATVTGSDGKAITSGVSYSWKLGTTAVGSNSATYTVPTTAEAGDVITLTVTVGEATKTATATVKAAEEEDDGTFAVTLDTTLPDGITVAAFDNTTDLPIEDLTKVEDGTTIYLKIVIPTSLTDAVNDDLEAVSKLYVFTITDEAGTTIDYADGTQESDTISVDKDKTITIEAHKRAISYLRVYGTLYNDNTNPVTINIDNAGANPTTGKAIPVPEGATVVLSENSNATAAFTDGTTVFTKPVKGDGATAVTEADILKGEWDGSGTGETFTFKMPAGTLSLDENNFATLLNVVTDADVEIVKATLTNGTTEIKELYSEAVDGSTDTKHVFLNTAEDFWVKTTSAEHVMLLTNDNVAAVKKTANNATAPATTTKGASNGVKIDGTGLGAAGTIYLRPAVALYVEDNITAAAKKGALSTPISASDATTNPWYVVPGANIIGIAGTKATGVHVVDVTEAKDTDVFFTSEVTSISSLTTDTKLAHAMKLTAGDGITAYVSDGDIADATAAKKLTNSVTKGSPAFLLDGAHYFALIDTAAGTEIADSTGTDVLTVDASVKETDTTITIGNGDIELLPAVVVSTVKGSSAANDMPVKFYKSTDTTAATGEATTPGTTGKYIVAVGTKIEVTAKSNNKDITATNDETTGELTGATEKAAKGASSAEVWSYTTETFNVTFTEEAD